MKKIVQKVVIEAERGEEILFGLVFLGSVFNAVLIELFPEFNSASRILISLTVGLSLGVCAKLRGRWV